MARNPYAFLDQNQARYGDLFVLRLPGMPPLHICADPKAVATLTASSYDDCERFGGGAEYFLGPRALICLQGDEHRSLRRQIGPGLHAERLRACLPQMDEEAQKAVAQLRSDQPLLMHEVFQSLTLRIILRCLFGDLPPARAEQLRSDVLAYLDGMFQSWMFALNMMVGSDSLRAAITRGSGWISRMPGALGRLVGRLPLVSVGQRQLSLHRLLDEEIQLCTRNETNARGGLLHDLVQTESGERQLSAAEVRDQVLMLLIGGHETTATTLAWTMHCLANHPAAVQRLRAELTSDVVQRGGPEALRTLPYLGAVIDEAMRLYPIAPFVSRRLRKPMQIADLTLPAGSYVNPCIYLIQRRADLWPEPTQFQPERMLQRAAPAAQFFPFGAGPWRCIGAAFALYELRIVLARILQHFIPQPLPGVVIHPELRWLTIAPSGGLPLRLQPAANPDHAPLNPR